MSKISKIKARQILDSRATPTVEAKVELSNGITATASCPSGASVSAFEAVELRDNDKNQFNGQGVLKAVKNVNEIISQKLIGMDVADQKKIDQTMINLDGTENKAKLGTNAILPVSLAVAKAAAKDQNLELFRYLRTLLKNPPTEFIQPLSAFNILNGGMHGGGNIDFQEFMIIPKSQDFPVALQQAVRVYKLLKKILKEKKLTALLGDEGGFSPTLASNTEAIDLLMDAITKANLKPNDEIAIGIDVASGSFYNTQDEVYHAREMENACPRETMIPWYKEVAEKYKLIYLEDPLCEDDFSGWGKLQQQLPDFCILVGDDLVSTNAKRLQIAIDEKAISGLIVKPNQIGTITETLQVVEMAKFNNLKINISHRSGETNDDFIADLAIAVNADFTKFGAPARGERVAKYNRLLEISEELT